MRLQPGFAARLRQRPHPADIGGGSVTEIHPTRIQQVEGVAGLDALVIGGNGSFLPVSNSRHCSSASLKCWNSIFVRRRSKNYKAENSCSAGETPRQAKLIVELQVKTKSTFCTYIAAARGHR